MSEMYTKTEVDELIAKAIEDDRAERAAQEFLDEEDSDPRPTLIPFAPFRPLTPEEKRAADRAYEEDLAFRRRADEMMLLTEVLKAGPGVGLLRVVEDRLTVLVDPKAEVRQ